MDSQPQDLYEFGPFRLDIRRPRLTRDGEVVALTPKALEVLSVLVQGNGTLVEKEVLIRRVWPDTFVEDGNLSVHIFALRKALGQTSGGENYIETIPRLGFRFTAPVHSVESNGADLIVERHIRSRVMIEERESLSEDKSAASAESKLLDAPRPWQGLKNWKTARTVALASIVLAVSGGAVILLRGKISEKATPPQPVRSIAVLPFKPLSAGSDDDYLQVGVADAVITKLGGLRQIVVRPTSATLRYTNSTEDPSAIGRALGVDAILEGHLQRDGDRIRATVQLVSVRDGSQLWAAHFDDSFTNVFAVQDSISDQVAKSLSLNLTAADRTLLAKRFTQNTDAYHAYLLGRHYWNKRTDESTRKAIEHFKRAIDTDPLYALAYAALAEAYVVSSYYSGVLPREAFPKAKAAAQRALEIDDTLAEAQSTLAYVKFIYDWDFQGAEKDFQRSFELNPNYDAARFWYGECLMYEGRFVEGVAQIKRAQELDPLSFVYSSNLGWAYHIARQDDQAIEQLQKVLSADSSFHMAYFYLGMAYESKGKFDDAIVAYQKSADLSGGYPGIVGLAHAYAMSGKREAALKIIAQLEEQLKHGKRVRPTTFSTIYSALNDRDNAFKWLEKAYEERYEGVIYVKVQPFYDNLRTDPRYFDLLQRIGLAP